MELQGLMITDQLFTEEGKFYTTHRQLMLQLERIEDMTSLGYVPLASTPPVGGKRPVGYAEASS